MFCANEVLTRELFLTRGSFSNSFGSFGVLSSYFVMYRCSERFMQKLEDYPRAIEIIFRCIFGIIEI